MRRWILATAICGGGVLCTHGSERFKVLEPCAIAIVAQTPPGAVPPGNVATMRSLYEGTARQRVLQELERQMQRRMLEDLTGSPRTPVHPCVEEELKR